MIYAVKILINHNHHNMRSKEIEIQALSFFIIIRNMNNDFYLCSLINKE